MTKGEIVCFVQSFCVILQMFLSANESRNESRKHRDHKERHHQKSNNEKKIAGWIELLLNDSHIANAFAWDINQLQLWKNNPANLLHSLIGKVWI